MSLYKIGTVTYDGLGPAAIALTRDREIEDQDALDMLYDALSRNVDSNGAHLVVLPVAVTEQ